MSNLETPAAADVASSRTRLIDCGYVLPTPMPGETIRSVWERFHRMSIGGSMKETLEAMFGAGARLRSGHCLPSRLAELSRRVGGSHPLADAQYAVERHTTLPFHCYFHTAYQREHAYASLVGNRGPAAARAMLGLAKALVLEERTWPAFCPQCTAEDMQSLGFSYWRTVHQLPAVAVCPWHGDRLREVQAERTDWSGYGYLPVPDLRKVSAGDYPPVQHDPRIRHEALWELAKACLHAQEHPAGFPGDWRSHILQSLIGRGFKSKNGLDHRRIAKVLHERHGEPMMAWLGLITPGKPLSDRALRRMLGFQRERKPTVLYILLALAIDRDLLSLERRMVGGMGSSSSVEDIAKQRHSPEVEKLIARVRRGDRSELNVAAAMYQLKPGVIRRMLFAATGHAWGRREPLTLSEQDALLRDAREGASSADLRAKYCLHLEDVFLVLERDPAARRAMERADFLARRDSHRQDALEFLAKNRELSTDDWRAALKGRFKQLQRYDLDWYRQHFPKPETVGRRIDDPGRLHEVDQKLSQQVARTIRILIENEGVASPTEGDVLSRCRATALFLKHSGQLPLTSSALASLP